ncbi:Wall-associated receptor kinase 3 [Morella rubra]|uniref:Wall-associated receptor kinase 3 n=1 Tax=Morella rubra TaxID=262757 RepID=A0A6A1VCD4_9ROSI|nr:Wall-associated receptor kinase 3 [Morella rubra]
MLLTDIKRKNEICSVAYTEVGGHSRLFPQHIRKTRIYPEALTYSPNSQGAMALLGMLSQLSLRIGATIVAASAASHPNSRCNSTCGSLGIPYPFGTSEGCYLDKYFLITCNLSYEPPRPFLRHSDYHVLNISLDGEITISSPVARDCYGQSGRSDDNGTLFYNDPGWRAKVLSKFRISSKRNKITAVGCDTYSYVQFSNEDKYYTTGCLSLCDPISSVKYGSCTGIGCCQTSIPEGAIDYFLRVGCLENHLTSYNDSPCGFDINECKTSNPCNTTCVNTLGSYKCYYCPKGFEGNGLRNGIGDACTDDVVMFEQNVYEMFNIASRSAGGPPSGTRTVVGRIVKESYGAAKQQHTFTTEVPLLVYEFNTNEALYDHIYDQSMSSTISWGKRLKIVAETSGVLAYLDFETSMPIIHRDVKSANILLDDTLTTKVSDFGASRLVPVDQKQVTTLVQRTIGYLDPEYFHTSQLTDKSDVYSFGVVLVELLMGKKVLSFDRPENKKNVANYFVSLAKEDQLFQMLQNDILEEGNIGEVKQVVDIAKKCLGVRGEDRPTMKEVAMELEGLKSMNLKHLSRKADLGMEKTELLLSSTTTSMTIDVATECPLTSTTIRCDSMVSQIQKPANGGR